MNWGGAGREERRGCRSVRIHPMWPTKVGPCQIINSMILRLQEWSDWSLLVYNLSVHRTSRKSTKLLLLLVWYDVFIYIWLLRQHIGNSLEPELMVCDCSIILCPDFVLFCGAKKMFLKVFNMWSSQNPEWITILGVCYLFNGLSVPVFCSWTIWFFCCNATWIFTVTQSWRTRPLSRQKETKYSLFF